MLFDVLGRVAVLGGVVDRVLLAPRVGRRQERLEVAVVVPGEVGLVMVPRRRRRASSAEEVAAGSKSARRSRSTAPRGAAGRGARTRSARSRACSSWERRPSSSTRWWRRGRRPGRPRRPAPRVRPGRRWRCRTGTAASSRSAPGPPPPSALRRTGSRRGRAAPSPRCRSLRAKEERRSGAAVDSGRGDQDRRVVVRPDPRGAEHAGGVASSLDASRPRRR